jgi:hypothetical protein
MSSLAAEYRLLTAPGDLPHMNPASIASALIAARVGQAQMAVAARMMRDQASMDAAAVQALLAAANQNAEQMAAAIQQGVGEMLDITV